MKRLLALAALILPTIALTPATYAATDGLRLPAPKAQKLVDEIVVTNPDLLDVLFHVTPTGETTNRVVAARLPADIGEFSGEDDLGVMHTAKPLVEVQKDGKRIGVLVQMKDAQGQAIGALGLMYPYKPGDDQQAVLQRSIIIRDRLAAKIPETASLF